MTDLFKRDPDAVNIPPFETEDLRQNLSAFLDSPFNDPAGTTPFVGNYKWGVYAFFDYDVSRSMSARPMSGFEPASGAT